MSWSLFPCPMMRVQQHAERYRFSVPMNSCYAIKKYDELFLPHFEKKKKSTQFHQIFFLEGSAWSNRVLCIYQTMRNTLEHSRSFCICNNYRSVGWGSFFFFFAVRSLTVCFSEAATQIADGKPTGEFQTYVTRAICKKNIARNDQINENEVRKDFSLMPSSWWPARCRQSLNTLLAFSPQYCP